MLVGLWGFISRLEEKLVYGEKESRWAVLSWNCDEMLVYGLQHTAQPSLGIMPTSLLVSSSIWTTTSPQTLPQASTTHPKIRLLPSSPNSPMSFPSCNRSPGCTLLLVSMAVEGPSLPYFQETVQTCMPNHALSCASHWLVGCPSTHQSGIHAALSELKYVGVTFLSLSLLLSENLPKNDLTSTPPHWLSCFPSLLVILSYF